MATEEPIRDNLTDDQLVQIAGMAEQAAPFIQFLTGHMDWVDFQKWKKAPAEHSKAMAQIKSEQIGLDRIKNYTSGFIERGRGVLARREKENSPEGKEQRRLDTEGFGLNFDQERAS